MKFDHFQLLMGKILNQAATAPVGSFAVEPERLHPLVLAYIGDAVFTLYVRTRLLTYEQQKVRVLHSYDAKMVSAVMQAVAVKELAGELSEAEQDLVRRGRNTGKAAPRSASVGEYRHSTGFETLLGYLFLSKQHERLYEIMDKAFVIISRKLLKCDEECGEEKNEGKTD
ncbi:Mini-ribonuclease 3 [Sporolituus thermophilus]|uniref:Mini-ribonuclease 3 n=1 Tax=Sporolituus thermophilus DSM 23256 TaxID=1123285 RepID=A0A1G7PHM4_9FIRM|nr:ribonuclease III domain-containing protein [Sporolituus thermophilus]SDF85728.1 ribonuclease-3 family protein [Sporolituus thermophilus DSM 23256]